jgi:uncharacterized phiE125 gp8 family phage protein
VGLALITPAAVDPVGVAEMREQLRIDTTAEDPYLKTVVQRAEAYLTERAGWSGIACLTSTWDYRLDGFPCGGTPREAAIRLPLRPVQSVTYLRYVDGEGVEQELVQGVDYRVVLDEDPALLVMMPGHVWPMAGYPWSGYQVNTVTVRFVAGWPQPELISPNVRNAIVLLAAHFYTNRDTSLPVPSSLLQTLLANERLVR